MDRARLALAVMAASLLASPSSWGQGDDAKKLVKVKQLDGEAKDKSATEEKPGAEEAEAILRKKLLACKKYGDCKAYLLEKKKRKNSNVPDPVELAPGAAGAASASDSPGANRPVPDAPAIEGERAGSVLPGTPEPTAAESEVVRQAAAGRGERTMGRAAAAAETLRRTMRPDAEPGAPGEGGPEAGSPAPDNPRAAPASPSPLSVPEMALAARAGYAGTFRDQGLKVGAGPRGEPVIQRVDGGPASAPELARLGEALSAEPTALARRPDFYEVIPREKFRELKQDFASRPELRLAAFKDIGLAEGGRDFRWTASCSGLSGACNAFAGEGSYRKGQYVPPEDLKKVWKAAHEESSEAEEGFGEYTEEDRRLAEAEDLAAEKYGSGRRLPANLSALLAKMGDMARGLGENVGLAAGTSPPLPAGVQAVLVDSQRTNQPGQAVPRPTNQLIDSPQANQAGAPPRANRGSRAEPRAAGSRGWLSAAAGAGLAFCLILLARRRRD